MDVCTNELQQKLQQKLTTLRRTPVPRPPSVVQDETSPSGELFTHKLKSTKQVETNTNQDEAVDNNESEEKPINNHEIKPKGSSIKDRKKAFENGFPGKPLVPGKPGVPKKPVIGVKPAVAGKPVNTNSNHNTEIKRARPPSVLHKPDQKIDESYKDTRIPELEPLPPTSALGNPPGKPPKLWSLKSSVKKYIGTSHPSRPVSTPKVEIDDTSPVVDAPPIPKKPVKPDLVKKHNEEADQNITEDFYDDTACSASNAADASEDFYDDTACGTANTPDAPEDFYDDTACSNEFATSGTQDEEFGEDIYEPIVNQDEQYKDQPADKAPPALPEKDHGKEDKKKKEKERKKKEKEEKEEKEREEKERKKREKDKEKKMSEMKRRFSVRGSEKSIGTCCAAEDITGNRMDISASIGEEFDVIRKGKPNPNNKWLVRNKQGQYGFIDINKIEKEPEDAEDLYEEVPASKLRSAQSSNGDHIPSPPVSSPPPPPGQSAGKPSPDEQDIYDDVNTGQDDEELYELLPEN